MRGNAFPDAPAVRRRSRALDAAQVLALPILVACACAAPLQTEAGSHASAKAKLSSEERQRNLDSFDQVWETVRTRHWDPTFAGVDWDALRAELRPRVDAARSTVEAREVMVELIGRLGQSHFDLLPAEVYGAMGVGGTPGTAAEAGATGITVRVVDGLALVTAVDEGSSAATAGVRPGWEVVTVADRRVAPLAERVAEIYATSTFFECMTSSAVQALFDGPAGSRVEAVFRDGAGKRVRRSLVLERPRGTPARFGHLPAVHWRFDARRLAGGAGYIGFNVFIDPEALMASFGEAVRSFRDAPGIVLDLRGNPGGLGAMAMGIGGWFVDREDLRLGTMHTREASLHFVLNPRAETYAGPLALLVDGCSMSTAEILAGGLQDLGRARVFGTPTAGAALPSMIERLPNGDGFQFAFASYVSVGGDRLEGRGVRPDVVAPPARRALLEGRDPALDAAIQWILSGTGAPDGPRGIAPAASTD
jgi:carboxyl-terminal processing protease